MLKRVPKSVLVLWAASSLLLPWAAATWYGAAVAQPASADLGGLWGKPVDGLLCRVTLQPRYAVGQPLSAVLEIKNTSNRKRYIIRHLDPWATDYVSITINGPKGKVLQSRYVGYAALNETSFQPIGPGEVKRIEVPDLAAYFDDLDPFGSTGKPHDVPTGKFDVHLRFRSPVVPARFVSSLPGQGKKVKETAKNEKVYKDAPAELVAGHWAGEIQSVPATFELTPLAKDDLVVHEWGVFTVLNDSKYANANRKEEWGSQPTFFYRQFPTERLRWMPSAWDKPIVYVYAKPTPLRMRVKVTFAEGAPVVWWPAASDPADNSPGPAKNKSRPFRSLTWDSWVGDTVPNLTQRFGSQLDGPLGKVNDFPLPPDCWLSHARLPSASRLTVIGNDPDKRRMSPGSLDRLETERFLYYDGLVPAPDYLFCEKVDATSVTLRNLAEFDIARLFLIDRRVKGRVGFALVEALKQAPPSELALKIQLKAMAAEDWPAAGTKHLRKALLDAGLFEAEANAVVAIWHKRFLEADGLTALHLLPASEYDRMLPLEIVPRPAARPVRVGIAWHPNLELGPVLAQRVAALIAELDDSTFKKRDAASKALLEIGPMAIGALRAALKQGVTLEIKRRIEAVLDRVDAVEWLKGPEMTKKQSDSQQK